MMFIRIFSIVVALIIVSCSNPIYHAVQQTHTDLVYQDVAFLADDAQEGRATGTKGERASAAYIAERMFEIGLVPSGEAGTFLQSFDFGGNPHVPKSENSTGIGYNVLGMINNPGETVIVVGAHYDHLGHGGFGSLHSGHPAIHNGADDNASGVALMLDLAQSLINVPMQSDILFMAFSGEEYGLLGSNHFTKSVLAEDIDYKFMINMDMVGRLDESRGLAINGTGTSPIWDLVIDESNMDNLKLVKSESGSGPSDHSSFYHMESPVLHFFTGQHEDYHKPSDDIEKVNFDGINKVGDLILNIIQKADEFTNIKFMKTQDEAQTNMSFKVTMGVMPDYLYQGNGMRIDGVLENRPAQRAGLQKGDIVLKIGDTDVTDMNTYMDALNKHDKGDMVKVKVKREDMEVMVDLTF